VGVGLVEGGGRRLRFTVSERDNEPGVAWCDVDAYDDVPINLALRRRTMVVGSLDELSARFADYVARQRGTTTVALAAVPVEAAGRPIGGFVLFYDRHQAFDAAQRQELTSLGHELGASLQLIQRGEARRAVLAAADDSGAAGLAADHEVAPEAAAVSEARRFLRGTLHDWDVDEETADTAVLCLSELVTNAVIHSHAGCSVRVQLDDGVLTVTVRDSGRADAQTVEELEDSLQVHGRGLQVVEVLASRWGYELDLDGTTVWFELAV
jgi:anti-sigma regulatory factor (Ser/Thr protein kinase)